MLRSHGVEYLLVGGWAFGFKGLLAVFPQIHWTLNVRYTPLPHTDRLKAELQTFQRELRVVKTRDF